MTKRRNLAWLGTLLFSIAGFSWYFLSSPKLAKVTPIAESDTSDIIINHLTVKRFDENGQLIHYMKTPLTRHIAHSNLHVFDSPYVALMQPNQPTWEVSSHFAKAKDDGSEVVFFDNVIVHQNKDNHTDESTMTTEELIYLPKKQMAESHSSVLFEQIGRTVRSEGVRIFLADKQIQLLKNAHARFNMQNMK